MDELGSRIRAAPAGRAPSFQLAPFAWRHQDGHTELLSLLWALRDVAEGEVATCAGRLGMADYSSQAYWCLCMMLSVDYQSTTVQDAWGHQHRQRHCHSLIAGTCISAD